MSIKKHLLALALSACVTIPAWAQESLIDVYRRAVENDPAVREAEATFRANSETKAQTRSLFLPTLNASANLSNQYSDSRGGVELPGGAVVGGDRNITDADASRWSLQLTQTLFDWGNFAQLRQADKVVARAETTYRAATQDLMLRVATRYFDVLAAEDNLASAVARRESVSRQLEQSQRRFEVGLIAITDVQQSQAGYDDANAAEIEAQRAVATAYEFLREIIGELVDDLASPTDELPLLSPDPTNAEQWVQTALQQNLALVTSRLATEIALDDIDIQRSNRLPTLSLSAGYSEGTNERSSTSYTNGVATQGFPSTTRPDGRQWSLDVRFPIFTGGLNQSRIRQSVYNHQAAEQALERIARQTERQTRDAYLGVISEISRVRALRQSVESNRTALRATEAGFEVGTQTTVDVLRAQELLSQAETTYSRSRYDYIRNTLLLKQAAGTLSEADIQQVDSWLQ
ncbi:MAG TPA: TolC family outer membrane protein [Gammaproteobacteria bacterium]|nr:TolC family outer membrane protein [Gammaproteobacteria bacterium]